VGWKEGIGGQKKNRVKGSKARNSGGNKNGQLRIS